MTPDENTKIAQAAYAAFGRGDIPALLKLLTDDVDWHGVMGVGPKVPQGGARRGLQEVGKFFEQVGATTAFGRFEPQQFVAQGDTVVALGYYDGTVKTTGKPFKSEWAMAFTIRGGKIAKFREYMDSFGITNAF